MNERRVMPALMAPGLMVWACVMAPGCATRERAPLDTAAVQSAWLSRGPTDASVREYAARLAQTEGRSEVFDPADGLSLAEAEPTAMVFNRDLRVARLEAGVVRARSANAGLWDDPVLGVELERILTGVPDPWIVGAALGITLPISGRLEAEKARGGAELGAELARVAAKEWATRASVREKWVEWSAAGEIAALAGEYVERLREVAALAARQEQAGVLSRVDVGVFGVQLAGREADAAWAAARAKELEIGLRDEVGLAPGAPVALVPTLVFTPRERDAEAVGRLMERGNAELAAVRAEYEVAEESLRVEVREQYPDVTVGPGYKQDGDPRVLLGLSLPVPLWNRNAQGVAEADAAREAARGRYSAAYEKLGSKLAAALIRYEAGRAVREAVETRVAPLADAQDADVRRVAELGRVDPLLLLEAVATRHEAKVRVVEARAAEALAAIRLDELMGPPVGELHEGGGR